MCVTFNKSYNSLSNQTDIDTNPQYKTIAAMVEADRLAHDPNVKKYSDVEEALAELKR